MYDFARRNPLNPASLSSAIKNLKNSPPKLTLLYIEELLLLSSDIPLKRVNHSDHFYGKDPIKIIEPQTTGQHTGPGKTTL
jgi:hypothetical protein